MTPSKKYYYFSISLFFLATILGFLFSRNFPDLSQSVIAALREKFQPIINASPFITFLFIFFNNSLIDFLMIFLFFLGGLFPFYILLTNGFSVGIVLFEVTKISSFAKITATLLPHGILEIPAFIIAASYSFWLSWKLVRKLFYHEPFKPHFKKALRTLFFLIIPLNFFAALIETFLTPLISSFF